MITAEWTNTDNLTVQNSGSTACPSSTVWIETKNIPTVDVVSWKDFRDFLDDNAEDFESIGKRLDAIEDRLNAIEEKIKE